MFTVKKKEDCLINLITQFVKIIRQSMPYQILFILFFILCHLNMYCLNTLCTKNYQVIFVKSIIIIL
jgi:hypothetical protein